MDQVSQDPAVGWLHRGDLSKSPTSEGTELLKSSPGPERLRSCGHLLGLGRQMSLSLGCKDYVILYIPPK